VDHGSDFPSVVLRVAVAAEAEALSGLALRSKAHWGYDDAFIEACRAELRVLPEDVEPHRLTVAVHRETGRVVGFSGLVGTSSEDAELSALFVEPDAIGTGVGRLLFDHAVRVADQLGFERLRIEADPSAAPFYEHMGATRAGTVSSHSIANRELPLYIVDVSGRLPRP
jgi:GNAT superfamily N-acetyltransferase